MSSPPALRVLVLMPVRDDWTSATELVTRLDRAISGEPFALQIMMVDDGSLRGWQSVRFAKAFTAVKSIEVLRLRRNVGHQRAIAVGLAYIGQHYQCDAVMVMDADGEDTPEGALQLLRAFVDHGCTTAIFAERIRRSESIPFRAFYQLYRFIHLLLTGIKVRVGNFSVLPFRYLSTLVVYSELWNHYAAAVFNSRLPFALSPVPRGTRIDGVSQMNFVSLAAHGLSAISVFGDRVGVRMLITSLAASGLLIGGIALAVILRLFTDLAIPDWATYGIGTLIVILIQLITIAASFTFFMLSNRTNLGFVPLRDYELFVAGKESVYPCE